MDGTEAGGGQIELVGKAAGKKLKPGVWPGQAGQYSEVFRIQVIGDDARSGGEGRQGRDAIGGTEVQHRQRRGAAVVDK